MITAGRTLVSGLYCTVHLLIVNFTIRYTNIINHQLNSTEFEVRLHSYREIHHHHHPPPHKLNLYTQNWEELKTAQLASRDLYVQVYSHTQTSEATLYYVFAAEL